MFKNLFSSSGRIRRLEYGISFIIYCFASTLLESSSEARDFFSSESTGPVALILFVPLLWFIFAQGAKRCHDLGNSGWYQIIPFYVFWMLFQDGDKGRNKYGENPKIGKNSEEGGETPLDYNPEIRK